MVFMYIGKKRARPFRSKRAAAVFGRKLKNKGYIPTLYRMNKVYLVAVKKRH